MLPVTPHLASECLDNLDSQIKVNWPEINNEYLLPQEYNIVIQINGKKRSLIKTDKEIDEKKLISQAMEMKEVKKIVNDRKIIKHIYIKNKLINLIIK